MIVALQDILLRPHVAERQINFAGPYDSHIVRQDTHDHPRHGIDDQLLTEHFGRLGRSGVSKALR